MSDPRNVAHDKKVKQEKEHEKPEPTNGSAEATAPAAAPAETDQGPDEHEKSVAILSKLKEMEFHSRGNIETLAELSLTIEDELKQKEFADPIGALYSAQAGFQTQITGLIEAYAAKCESLKSPA